ncbi:MAG: hypothetical protein ACXAAK_10170 [Candidatus Thorarchaeota archaeon]
MDEEPKSEPEPIEELEELLAKEPEVESPSLPDDESLVRPSEVASSPEDEPLVRPSDVASEQAEEETSEEMVEVPEPEPAAVEPEEDEPSEPMDDEKGKEVVQDILEKVRAAEARSREEEDTELEPPPAPLEAEESLVYEEPMAEPEVEEPSVDESESPQTGFMAVEEPSDTAEAAPSAETASVTSPPVETTDVLARDEKIREYESDITANNIELEQLQSELGQLRTRLDEEVERYLVASETKRSRTEGLERELTLAKKEFSDANKEHKNAENRRKKELSNAEKRIREVEKQIKKAEDGKEKRIRDLEKERLKSEEEAKKD